ncbi:SGNH/GDSL hydrolase family protein [Gordonia sp. TBRC 11910]|uniref:SGNH/GDSL hydrolase family protein n=1 Tax=Gordonia asplenii TaxID=2725283 RepID=A0A848L1I9_9ACTN|nr:SGNH/GDSL hydrolase family protein [Gordonia asplenii]NMO04744.1 SGNH/GDSL hydrolase family protein [Gordonia asplenii]
MRVSARGGQLRRRLATAVAGAVLVVSIVAPGAAAAPQRGSAPAGKSMGYVNLGDSYSAASGVMPLAAGVAPLCMQSARNYAKIIADRFGYRYTDVSCAGASTKGFFSAQYPGVPRQLDAVRQGAALVTIAVGGNDGDVFAPLVVACTSAAVTRPGAYSPCKDANGNSFVQRIETQTYPHLIAAFRAVRAAAPHATVAALNYPWIMPDRPASCPGFPVARGDMPYVHGIQAALNDAVERAAEQTGVRLVDVASASVGHDACEAAGIRWIEPLAPQGDPTPVHPNELGALQMARITARSLGLARRPSDLRWALNTQR